MKMKYEKPVLSVEILTKTDVLLRSEETDNRFASTDSFVKVKEPTLKEFQLEDIL